MRTMQFKQKQSLSKPTFLAALLLVFGFSFMLSNTLLSNTVLAKADAAGWCAKYHKDNPGRNNTQTSGSVIPNKWDTNVCKGWYTGGYENNDREAIAPANKDAKAAGLAQRKKDGKADSGASTSSASLEGREWCKNYINDHPGASNYRAIRGTYVWSAETCADSYDAAKKNKKCTTGSSNPHIKASCAAGEKAASGSSGGSGSSSSGSGSGSGSSGGSSTSGGSTSGGAGSSSGSGSAAPAPEGDKTRTVEDPAIDCAKEGASEEDCDLVAKYLNPMIAFFSAFVGIAVVIGIVSGGIRYASASDDPQKSAAARQMIRNSIIALVAYIFLYAALTWLIPQ